MKFERNGSSSTMKTGLFRLPTILTVVFICIFFSLSTLIAFRLKRDIIPDEAVHVALSEYFTTSWGIPPDTPQTYQYGLIAQKPFLYYWINGRLLNVLHWVIPEPGSWKILVILRLVSVFYSTLAVIFCYLLAREVIKSPWWQALVLFLLTNTMMFVFLSGGANYDSLVNLCSFAGIYFFIRLLNGKSFYLNSLACMICVLAGTLVKITVLPLLAIMAVLWVLFTIQNRKQINFKPVIEWKLALLLVVFGSLVILNFLIFGINLIQYRAVIPSCTMLLSESECEQNPIFVRDREAAEKFSVRDMFNGNVPDPITWFAGYWAPTMLKMTFGFAGGRHYTPSALSITLISVWFIAMLLLAIRFHKKASKPLLGLAAIVIFYMLTLLQTNLFSELNTGFKHLGIQGRYLFPVLGGLFVIFVYFAASIQNRVISRVVVIATLVLFSLNSPLRVLAFPAPVQFPSTQITPEEKAISIAAGSEVSQDFRSECSGSITQVDVLLSPRTLTVNLPVNLTLTDLNSREVITQQRVVNPSGEDQVWQIFIVPSLPVTRDQPYQISLSTDDGDHNQALILWNTKTNVYRGGDAIVKGVPTNNDLVFRYTCKMPPLTDWFNEL